MAEARLEIVKTQDSILKAAQVLLKEQDEMIRKQRKELEFKDRQLVEAGRIQSKVTERAVASLRETLNAEQQKQLDVIVDSHKKELSIRDQQIEGHKAMVRLLQTQISARDSLLERQSVQLDKLTKDYEKEVKRKKDSATDIALKTVPWIIAGAAILSRR